VTAACAARAKTVVQCKTCPWRVGCVPEEDIPGYNLNLAKKLDATIATGDESLREILSPTVRIMACHYSKPNAEIHCAGWLHNQLGVGNNLAVRLRVMTGAMPVPRVSGDQHGRYEDTLPCDPRPAKKRRGRR
jgi:hypothetical protein